MERSSPIEVTQAAEKLRILLANLNDQDRASVAARTRMEPASPDDRAGVILHNCAHSLRMVQGSIGDIMRMRWRTHPVQRKLIDTGAGVQHAAVTGKGSVVVQIQGDGNDRPHLNRAAQELLDQHRNDQLGDDEPEHHRCP